MKRGGKKTTSIPRECLAQHFYPSTMTRSDRCHTNQTRRTDETLSYLYGQDDGEDVFIYFKKLLLEFPQSRHREKLLETRR